MNLLQFLLLILYSCVQTYENSKCLVRDFGNGSPVCLCNSEYCDEIVPEAPLENGIAFIYSSSKLGMRFQRNTVKWKKRYSTFKLEDINEFIVVDAAKTYQNITGFGGAFTDSACSNIDSLPEGAQKNLLKSYFGNGGIGYSTGRVPMASTDFSPTNYSYDDIQGDFNLDHFSLANEDINFKIPIIKKAMQMSKYPLKLFACPWSAPYWMKTNQMMQGIGTLIGKPGGQYYKTWANYFIKFLDEYIKLGIRFWGLSAQNQPSNGFDPNFKMQSMGFTAKMERDFIKLDLGPALHKSQHKDIKLIIFDDQRYSLPKWLVKVLNDTDVIRYVSYVAVHWYGNEFSPPQLLDEAHEMFPQIPLIGTEACIIGLPGEKVLLGSWERAERYAKDIIETLNYWYTGWTDWNLAVDTEGGPNAFSNFVDSPIIINKSSGEFYKQPMFYALGHFSTFLPPNSSRIDTRGSLGFKINLKECVLWSAFKNPNGNRVVILLNLCDCEKKFELIEKYIDMWLPITMPARSIQTVIWK